MRTVFNRAVDRKCTTTKSKCYMRDVSVESVVKDSEISSMQLVFSDINELFHLYIYIYIYIYIY